MTGIDEKALDSLSVAPNASNQERDPRQDAGQDKSINKRLEKNPDSADARLDAGLDESMDASDPPSMTQPGHDREPAPSSGFDEEAERNR
ncbi:hypothetical protein [Sphingomonas sp. RIT328]|uniref:hypothetical protein n=1 Tax=Sphingomonas sp. RIT328 TaxID=1470591 RepID=UPI0004492533|nr:hypothetical protein [Sphingomonas sp. RIT328]EZP55362.1 hypothetical protein BW41_01100 [Sphingomonas sp. RIT328]